MDLVSRSMGEIGERLALPIAGCVIGFGLLEVSLRVLLQKVAIYRSHPHPFGRCGAASSDETPW